MLNNVPLYDQSTVVTFYFILFQNSIMLIRNQEYYNLNYAFPQFSCSSSAFQILYMKMQCNIWCNTALAQCSPSNFFLILCTCKVLFVSMLGYISSYAGHFFFYIFELQKEFPIKVSFTVLHITANQEGHWPSVHIQSSYHAVMLTT